MSPDVANVIERMHARRKAANALSVPAFLRLLATAERVGDPAQVRQIIAFLVATFDTTTYPLQPCDLGPLDGAIAEDMAICVDALRWGPPDMHALAPGAIQRVIALIEQRGAAIQSTYLPVRCERP
jgi:hypothetical protein